MELCESTNLQSLPDDGEALHPHVSASPRVPIAARKLSHMVHHGHYGRIIHRRSLCGYLSVQSGRLRL